MNSPAEPDLPRLRRNPVLLCAFHALHMGLFPIAVITLFLCDHLGLSMFEVFVLQAIFGAAVALLEFPSGYVADRLGYRRLLLAAAVLLSVGWAAYALAVDFWTALLAELVIAAAVSFISGADTALLYESLLARREEADFGRWFSRYRSLGNAAEGSAALLGSVLFVHWPRLPFVLQAVVSFGALAVGWALVEPARDRGPVVTTAVRVHRLVRYALFEKPRLRALVALYVSLSLPSYVMVWILPVYARDVSVSAAWLGPLWAIASYTVALATLASPAFGRRMGLQPALGVCVLLIVVGYAGLGLTHAWYGVAFYLALCVLRGLQLPLLHHEEQRMIPSSDRAGLLSLNSLAFRASFVAVGPVVGYALDHAAHDVVLLCCGALFGLVAAGAWLWFRGADEAVPVSLPTH